MFEAAALRALVLSFFAGMSTLLGAFIIFVTNKKSEKLVTISLGFAGGVMISVSFTDLLPNANNLLTQYGGYRFGILAMELEKKNKKVVYLDIPPYDSQGVRVLGDNYQCVYDAISQCIERGYDQLLVVSDANESEYTGMDNLRGFKDAANDAGVSFKTYFIEAETTREEIHDYLEQNISEYKKTLVYASDVEALRKVYLGIKLFPDFQSLFPERLGLIGFDVTGWTKIAVPEISAIMIPAYQEGQIASRKLIEMIESKNSISNKKVIIKNAVRWRDSTL